MRLLCLIYDHERDPEAMIVVNADDMIGPWLVFERCARCGAVLSRWSDRTGVEL